MQKYVKEALAGSGVEVPVEARFITEGFGNDGYLNGKYPLESLKEFFISLNDGLKNVILKERSRLKDTAIFFVVVDSNKLPSRKLFDEWLTKI